MMKLTRVRQGWKLELQKRRGRHKIVTVGATTVSDADAATLQRAMTALLAEHTAMAEAGGS